MTAHDRIRAEIGAKQNDLEWKLRAHIRDGERLAVIQAPPGSGKTHTLLGAVEYARRLGLRVAVAGQTNSQANDICRRINAQHPRISATRLAAAGSTPEDLGSKVAWVTRHAELPAGPCVVVATTAKWAMTDIPQAFDILFVDEAWQMCWGDFMLCHAVAERFILIGDPGQIPPLVSTDPSRWETAPMPPHLAAPEVILNDRVLRGQALCLQLPASRRLPYDTVELIRPLYDFHFDAWAGPGERSIKAANGVDGPVDRAINQLATGSVVVLAFRTADGGPPLEKDDELANAAAEVAVRLLKRAAAIRIDGETRSLDPADIGIVATHRAMNAAMELKLPSSLRGRIVVDTPERWQGLERDVMIAIHPLSGVLRPSAFDLETGRLCVMASRHRGGLVLVSRDHIPETLDANIPSAEQAVGRPDTTGRGHEMHSRLWATLNTAGRIVSV